MARIPGRDVQGWFVVSVLVMAAHKVECFYAREWLDSPFFVWLVGLEQQLATNPADAVGETIFLTFVIWLFIGLTLTALVMRGGWPAKVGLGLWGLTYLLEWHHLGRAIAAGGYYPGLVTACVYLPTGVGYWRALWRWDPIDPEPAR